MISTKPSTPATQRGITFRTRVKAGSLGPQHNQAATGLRVKSRVKAGGITGANHNHAVKGIRIRSRIRAGYIKKHIGN